VSRLEPENNAHAVIEGFERLPAPVKLAIVGDAPYAAEYISRIKATRDPRIVFTGGVYGRGYRQLQTHARLYVQATEVGGTHPALVARWLRPRSWPTCPGAPEVLADTGIYFEAGGETLTSALRASLSPRSPRIRQQAGRGGALQLERGDRRLRAVARLPGSPVGGPVMIVSHDR
jgi:glycosyltransferase involved in cell wall biosynthesis